MSNYIPPKRTPRMPPVDQVNRSEVMLGSVLLALTIGCVIGAIFWAVKYH
jgi:hypothetical protein